VRQLRLIVLWPLQLLPLPQAMGPKPHVQVLAEAAGSPWREVQDEFTGDPRDFQERHYAEFVNFLPYVQRVLYGTGKGRDDGTPRSPAEASALRVFRRDDVHAVSVTLHRDGEPLRLQVAHVDLYFFHDLDIVVPTLEVTTTTELELAVAQEFMFRFGRAYPPWWKRDGQGAHCPWRVEWLGADGQVLALSDYEQRERYLAFVGRHRAPAIASHWEWLLEPLVHAYSSAAGALRYRQLEYHRMPAMAWVAFDDIDRLTRADWVRLGLISPPGSSQQLPYSARYLADFEQRYCFDRYFQPESPGAWMNTRLMCSGHAFVMAGQAAEPRFTDLDTGLQGQFRHQNFLLFLLAHAQKAGLHMLSDRLVEALSRLDVQSVETVKTFKRSIRDTMEVFLRFTHRYWFHEISNQAQIGELFRMLQGHLGTQALYEDLRDEVKEMNAYLESDTFRRQANTVVRLTVATVFGLIGSVVTGFFGMNVFNFGDGPLALRMLALVGVAALVSAVLFYTVAKAKPLADFLDAVSDPHLRTRAKFAALLAVWRTPPQPGPPTPSSADLPSPAAPPRR
jgi:hypothetical protein